MVAICENMRAVSMASNFFCELRHSHLSRRKSKGRAALHVAFYAEVGQLESCSRDPIGYVDGQNFYLAYFALANLDPSGRLVAEGSEYWSEHMRAAIRLKTILEGMCNKCTTCDCDLFNCHDQAMDIAEAIFNTLEQNIRYGAGERYNGYWCHQWAKGFKEAIDDILPSPPYGGEAERPCFASPTLSYCAQIATGGLNDRTNVHWWATVSTPCSDDVVHIDDSFADYEFIHPITPPMIYPLGPYDVDGPETDPESDWPAVPPKGPGGNFPWN